MYHVQGPCQDEKSVCPLNESWADLEPPARACLSVVSCPSSPLSPESALVNASPHDHARRHSPMRLPYFGGHISDSCAGCIHRPTRFASRLCGCDGTAVAFFFALLHGRQESSREATREENELMKAKAPKVFAVMCTQRDQVGGRSARGVGITLFSFLFSRFHVRTAVLGRAYCSCIYGGGLLSADTDHSVYFVCPFFLHR